MSLINKEVGEFSVQGFHKGDFVEVSKKDILGKWMVHLRILSSRLHICLPYRVRGFTEEL